jgi:hypothetical protein
VTLEAFALKVGAVRAADVRSFVPIDPEPSQPVENPLDHLGRGTLGVGVLDAKDEGAAVAARVKPVEQRRARATHMQVSGGRGGETDAGSWHR